jgi:hypothetical protein
MVYGWGNRRPSYWISILYLIGHLFGTALIFTSWFLFAWGISFLLSWCNAVHPLPVEISWFVTKTEIGLVYADAVFCGVVLLGGTWRFIRDML